MRSDILAGINSYISYELYQLGATFIWQNWDFLIKLTTLIVWKWAKTHPLYQGDHYNAIYFLDPKSML